ncbi:uncharacterized protein B0J16DRAFT_406222 [Fusarium flagelliforme]|uniref:uncharacterized protein n=1 Tax=Fusarium flagelliforme TaxID=2675880 RepID=UPI001E8CA79A|nr:uncharacterized protein B0J16DRAFT_406222 [Fusarium flagelliforme]KAH7173867.1 hypothetical protein B0J16DRAFT_406222 [Fusarium flagelliforme]
MPPDDKKPTITASYGDDVCRIFFQSQGPCLISRKALAKCPIIASRLGSKSFFSNSLDSINIEEIPHDVGAVVIHFLRSKRYRTLTFDVDSEDERNRLELRTAYRVYAAAVDLELIALKNAAQNVMSDLENLMDLKTVAMVLKETGLHLEEWPCLTMHIYSLIQASKGVTSSQDMPWIIAEHGFPESVNVDSFQSSLVSKGSPWKKEEEKSPKPQSRAKTWSPSNPSEDKPKLTSSKTWAGIFPKDFSMWRFGRGKAQSEQPEEVWDEQMPVDQIMEPPQGLSEDAMAYVKHLSLSIVGQECEAGDVGLQNTIITPPPDERNSYDTTSQGLQI